MHALRFAIDERPRCVWVADPRQRSDEFLGRIDPDYFKYLARIHVGQIATADEHAAALSLRMAYSHALEAFFAFVGATLQAPECTYAWLAAYKTEELRSLVAKITGGRPILSRLEPSQASWHSISEAVHEPLILDDKEQEKAVREGFGAMWRRFAGDFLDANAHAEYNSIKHGFRVGAGGFSLAVGEEEQPGIACPPERMVTIGGGKFGSTFLVMEPLGRSKTNYRTRRHSRNWSPSNLANGLVLLSMSLNNVVSRLRILAGTPATSLKFSWPSDPAAFDAPWAETPGVTSASIDYHVDESRLELLSAVEILDVYARKTEQRL